MLEGLPTRGYLSAAAVRGMGVAVTQCRRRRSKPHGRAGAYHRVSRRTAWNRPGGDLSLFDGRKTSLSLGRPGSLAPARSRAIEDKVAETNLPMNP